MELVTLERSLLKYLETLVELSGGFEKGKYKDKDVSQFNKLRNDILSLGIKIENKYNKK